MGGETQSVIFARIMAPKICLGPRRRGQRHAVWVGERCRGPTSRRPTDCHARSHPPRRPPPGSRVGPRADGVCCHSAPDRSGCVPALPPPGTAFDPAPGACTNPGVGRHRIWFAETVLTGVPRRSNMHLKFHGTSSRPSLQERPPENFKLTKNSQLQAFFVPDIL